MLTPTRIDNNKPIFYYSVLRKNYLNLIVGYQYGFIKYLQIKGLGYKTQIKKNILILKLGYSHILK